MNRSVEVLCLFMPNYSTSTTTSYSISVSRTMTDEPRSAGVVVVTASIVDAERRLDEVSSEVTVSVTLV